MSEKPSGFVRSADTSKPFIARDGATIFELLRPETSAVNNMSIASGSLESGQIARRHYHVVSEEAYYVVSGEGVAHVGEVSEPIKTGDVVHVPVGVVHGLENVSSTDKMHILAISSPPYSDDDIFFV
ncbi:MAG: cupin domain-containing protein [Candidatus Levybacteria bacterium]|nr:cupin domain-containing protein [Candidatus Levybacteria bacterium]